MSDLILRRDAKGCLILYRHKTNQAVMFEPGEIVGLYDCLTKLSNSMGYFSPTGNFFAPYAYELGTATFAPAPAEFHRLITASPRGKLTVGSLQPDLFDVRNVKDC